MASKNRTITLNGTKFTLGKKYKDSLLGVTGVAEAGAQYLTGCDQLKLTYMDAGGSVNNHWVDVTRIENVKTKTTPGGPTPMMPLRHP